MVDYGWHMRGVMGAWVVYCRIPGSEWHGAQVARYLHVLAVELCECITKRELQLN